MTILVHDMTPLEHITSIHWPCCCIVNTCGVIHFYENLWFYLVKSNLCRFIYICSFVGSNYQRERERIGLPLNSITLPHLCACLKAGTEFTTSYVVFFPIVWVERVVFVLLILMQLSVDYDCLSVDYDCLSVDYDCLSFFSIIKQIHRFCLFKIFLYLKL